jgi:hypothetical protein
MLKTIGGQMIGFYSDTEASHELRAQSIDATIFACILRALDRYE